MSNRSAESKSGSSDAPFGAEVKRPAWPMTTLWTLYFLWGAVLIALAIMKLSAPAA